MRIFLLAFVLVSFSSCLKSIKDTTGFITYFNDANNVRQYQQVRTTIQELARNAKQSTSLTAEDKIALGNTYNAVQLKAQTLYNKIVADLLSSEKRKEMIVNTAGYFAGVNNDFLAIKNAYDVFVDDYKTRMGARGTILAWVVSSFVLPIGKKFVDEKISDFVRTQLEEKLKPVVLIKPWEQL